MQNQFLRESALKWLYYRVCGPNSVSSWWMEDQQSRNRKSQKANKLHVSGWLFVSPPLDPRSPPAEPPHSSMILHHSGRCVFFVTDSIFFGHSQAKTDTPVVASSNLSELLLNGKKWKPIYRPRFWGIGMLRLNAKWSIFSSEVLSVNICW